MEPIYVTGHRNPDTDSVVSAMAYAALRNSLGDREYVPARLGHLSDETKLVLERFGFEAPVRIKTMRTQVHDLDFDTPPALYKELTVSRGWQVLQKDASIAAVPVTTEDGRLFGMLSAGDVASYDMESISDPSIRDVPLYHLLSVLEGKLLNETADQPETISGDIVFALPKGKDSLLFDSENYVAICGNQPEVVRWALESNVHCMILCQAELPEEVKSLPTKTCIISTAFDAYRAARLIFQAIPISRICRTKDLQCFHLDDFVDDVREVVSNTRYRCYPILDENECVVGTLSRYHLIKPRRKRVVLVDHNELAQSVPGLEQAQILEIIDHHRLADIQTLNPIYFRNEPVGSTTTIVAGMYQERGIMPSQKLAGLMAAAILSDTVMFKSPTTTDRDRTVADRLARIGNVSLDALGKEIFSATCPEDKSAADLLQVDFKEFHIAGHDLGVSQITCVDFMPLLQRREEFLQAMLSLKQERNYDMTLLMITDVLLEGTQLIFLGDEDIIEQAFSVTSKNQTVFLPGILSRKKQVIPMLSALWG